MQLSAQHIKQKAQEIGFDACGIAQVTSVESEIRHFDQWIAAGYHAGMHYMENHRDIRFNPDGLVEGARSVISVALNYYPQKKLSEELPHIAYYAYGKDYQNYFSLSHPKKNLQMKDLLHVVLPTLPLFWNGTGLGKPDWVGLGKIRI